MSKLNRKDAEQLGGAIHRWHEIRDQQIKTPTLEAELKGLTEYIAGAMLEHADEFIGCYFAVQDELSPMVNLIVRIRQRCDHVQEMYMAHARAVQTEQAQGRTTQGPEANIVPITK